MTLLWYRLVLVFVIWKCSAYGLPYVSEKHGILMITKEGSCKCKRLSNSQVCMIVQSNKNILRIYSL